MKALWILSHFTNTKALGLKRGTEGEERRSSPASGAWLRPGTFPSAVFFGQSKPQASLDSRTGEQTPLPHTLEEAAAMSLQGLGDRKE